jgi:hypothetical protein
MKSKSKAFFIVLGLSIALVLSNCATTRHYDFSLKNTLAVFLLNNGGNHFFCIPVQYVGDYQIQRFEFNTGHIVIGDYVILLKRDEINIYVYLNENAEDPWSSDDEFNLIYSEENGGITVSKMNEPLAPKSESDETMNHYYIFIEKHLTDDEMKNMAAEYGRGKVYSTLDIWYDMTIDNEIQDGNGMLDDFELYDGSGIDPAWLLPNLNFFRAKYL